MTNRLWIVIMAGLMASPALAQESEELDLGYEIGVGMAPWFLAWMDVEPTQPPFVLVAIPAGKSRLQVDYLRSTRRQPWWYSDADEHGRYTTARADFHVEQLISVVVKRPWRRLGRRGYLLFGGAWRYYTDRWCVAFRQDDAGDSGRNFHPGFECSKEPVDVRHRGIAPVYGVGWDLPLGSSAFWSLQYRARWLPMLGELRIGVGYRF